MNSEDKRRKDRYDDEDLGWEAVTYETLTCRDCTHVYTEPHLIMLCEVYDRKPGNVIYGGECEKKQKNDSLTKKIF